MQVLAYIQTFENDTKYIKYMVQGIVVLTTLSVIFLCHGMYYYVITNFDNPSSLSHHVWSWAYLPVVIALVTFIVECFFAIRVYKLSGYQKKLLVLIVTLSVISNGIKIAAAVEANIHSSGLPKNQQIPACVSLALTAACGCVISVLQAYYLHKGRTGVKRTDHVINVLIAYTISTGALTSILALFGLTFFAAMPKASIYWAACSISAGTYSNALLASLNGRRYFRSETASNTVATTNVDVQTSSPPIFMTNKTWMSIIANSTKENFVSEEAASSGESTSEFNF